jgi:hypothetical protein
MKVDFKLGNETILIDFQISTAPVNTNAHIVAIVRNYNELDKLEDFISKAKNAGDARIGDVIAKVIEKKLGVPCEASTRYSGAGFGINIDIYSLIKSKLQ